MRAAEDVRRREESVAREAKLIAARKAKRPDRVHDRAGSATDARLLYDAATVVRHLHSPYDDDQGVADALLVLHRVLSEQARTGTRVDVPERLPVRCQPRPPRIAGWGPADTSCPEHGEQ